MAKQTINVGTVANDGTGDTIRTAMTKVNSNFTEVYDNISGLSEDISSLTPRELVCVGTNDKLSTVSGLYLDEFGTIRYERVENTDTLPALVISDTSNTFLTLVEYSESAETFPSLILFKRRGSKDSSQPSISGDVLGVVSAVGVDRTSSGRILWRAASTTSSSNTDSTFQLQTKISGTLATRLEITESGSTKVTSVTFADNTIQSSASISISNLKALVAASTDFADFKSRIAAL